MNDLLTQNLTSTLGFGVCLLPLLFYKNKPLFSFLLACGLSLIIFNVLGLLNVVLAFLNLSAIFSTPNLILSGFLFLGIFGRIISSMMVYRIEIYKIVRDVGIRNITYSVRDFFKFNKMIELKFGENHQIEQFGPHSAAIVAVKPGPNGRSGLLGGIDLLETYHREQLHLPFSVYICDTKERVKEIICDKNVEKIWIFGHGTYYGLNVGGDFLGYIELKDAPKKDFIGQFHCCADADCRVSLADLILKPEGKKFVKEGYRCVHQNRKDIEYWNTLDWNCPD
jgi:hypothetical protein